MMMTSTSRSQNSLYSIFRLWCHHFLMTSTSGVLWRHCVPVSRSQNSLYSIFRLWCHHFWWRQPLGYCDVTVSLCPGRRTLCCILLIIVLSYIERKKRKSRFCFFTVRKQHKARELDIISLRNHALRSYMTWLPMTLSVLDMIIV